MSPKKTTAIVCVILLLSTICMVGLLYRSNLNEADDLLSQYLRNTQNFERSTVTSTIEEARAKDEISAPTYDNSGVKLPGIPSGLSVPSSLEELIMMSDSDIWTLCSNGAYSSEPKKFSENEDTLNAIYSAMAVSFDAKVWVWDGNSGYDKKSETISITCNKIVQPLIEAVMSDIYNDPSKPVMHYDGCYVVRCTSGYDTVSGHAIGCALDFNSTSEVNGYGNKLNSIVPTETEWQNLPESRTKYEIFYEDCPVVCIFKKYGFTWGGDFSSRTDPMHFSFLCDYSRSEGQSNYNKYKNWSP